MKLRNIFAIFVILLTSLLFTTYGDTINNYYDSAPYVPATGDTDSDGLTDEEELLTYGTCPILSDTDGDH